MLFILLRWVIYPKLKRALEEVSVNQLQRAYLGSINGGGKPLRAPITTAHPLVSILQLPPNLRLTPPGP